jgi:hypothetical protein
MDIMLKVNLERQLLATQKTLIYVDRVNYEVVPGSSDQHYLTMVNCESDSSAFADGYSMRVKQLMVYEKSGRLIFTLYGLQKQE